MEGIVALTCIGLVMVFASHSWTITNVPLMVEIVADQNGTGIVNVILGMTIQFVGMMEETVAKEILKPLVMGFVKMKITMQGVALMAGLVAWQT